MGILKKMVSEARSSPRRRAVSSNKADGYASMLVSGIWEADDAIEALLDEMSTSVNVGQGIEKPIGTVPNLVQQYLKKRGRKKPSKTSAWEFLQRVAPGLSETLSSDFMTQALGSSDVH